jgi:hypothetical protein
MNGEPKDEKDPARGYVTDIFNSEKYVIPGACAVGMLILFPWYLLGGSELGTWDLGTAVIGAFVAGHLLESLKVYKWGPRVRNNSERFDAKLDGLLEGWGRRSSDREQAKTILFTLMPRDERSELSWNLVRWQKMTVLGVILLGAGVQWLMFAALAFCDHQGHNVFRSKFEIEVLKPEESFWYSCLIEVILATALVTSARFVYVFGLGRQIKNNETYIQLISRHKDSIFKRLDDIEAAEQRERQVRKPGGLH